MSEDEQEDHRRQIQEGDKGAIAYFKQALAQGRDWYISLLEAICLWASAEEEYDGRRWRYLIDNEAFDWHYVRVMDASGVYYMNKFGTSSGTFDVYVPGETAIIGVDSTWSSTFGCLYQIDAVYYH